MSLDSPKKLPYDPISSYVSCHAQFDDDVLLLSCHCVFWRKGAAELISKDSDTGIYNPSPEVAMGFLLLEAKWRTKKQNRKRQRRSGSSD